jgi:hypothetical protein
MWLELLVAFLLIVASVVIHGLGTFSLIRWILPLVQNIHSLAFAGALWRMLCFFLALVTLHFLECAVWAEFSISCSTVFKTAGLSRSPTPPLLILPHLLED